MGKMSDIGKRIQNRRIQLGMTQEELASLILADQKKIWRYESGENEPSLKALVVLAEALNTSIDWLVGRTDYINPPISDLSDKEREMLNIYRSKSPESQQKIVDIAKVV